MTPADELPKTVEVTRILASAQEGDDGARERVYSLVYDELRAIAEGQMRRQSPSHTLAPTDLVNEACLRLVDREAPWESRSHFYCVAAKAMRSILVDHARARRSQKRGGELQRSPLHEAVAIFEERSHDLLTLDAALDELKAFDERKARLTELRFFGGLTMPEVAKVLDVSLATAEREWTVAKAWLKSRIGPDSG